MSTNSAKQRRNRPSSQASLGMSMNDDMEMSEKGRPQSSQSRNAWSDDDLLTGQGDDVDFASPRAPPSAAVDVIPSAMEAEPAAYQKRVPADVRAPGAKNVPVGCWTRFKRIVRGKVMFFCLTES